MRTVSFPLFSVVATLGVAASLVTAQGQPAATPKPAPAAPAPVTAHPVPDQPDQPEEKGTPKATPEITEWKPDAVDMLRKEAGSLIPLANNMDVRRFMFATTWLPAINQPREVYLGKGGIALTKEKYEALPEAERSAYTKREFDGYGFYYTKYGSPLAYMRPLDLACDAIGGDRPLKQKKILDYGYGTIGHLRLLASQSADVTGVDVDPVLPALYSEADDQGKVPGAGLEEVPPAGKLTLVHGRWPADASAAAKVGGDYDLIISKNTLKNGFLNPEHPADKRTQIDLGVGQEEFVAKLAGALKPGGVLIIYNICPKQKEKPEEYIPWADGKCPFPREMLEEAGFEVVEYNKDDTEFCRRMGAALEWNQGPHPMDLENDLVAEYTLVRKRGGTPADAANAKKKSVPAAGDDGHGHAPAHR